MDTTAIAALATQLSQTQTAAAVSVTVLRKAMDIQAEGALQLINAVPSPAQPSSPPHLGNAIDVFA